MKTICILFILLWTGFLGFAQEFDISTNVVESGTKTYQARNSITFASGYTYTPSGGALTAEIVNPLVTGMVTYNSIIDPESRILNTAYPCRPGTTEGLFAVNSAGNASYTIPIEALPGVGGLQPSLTLQYNSSNGPGIVGYGWNLGGLSVVARNPQVHYYDGTYKGVDLATTDRFSLDGQRLVCTSGTYGANGSVYRTENDIFSKTTCYTGSYGPDRFEVKTKSGLTCQYGYDNDADQTVDGHNETVSWFINKITDVYGNVMDFTYLKDEGVNYIAEITYGANAVIFFYKQRSDIKTVYLKGKPLKQQLILDHIEIRYNSALVKKYEFKYNYSSSDYNRYSVLNELIEYGLDDSRYNSIAFTYHTPDAVSFSRTADNGSHSDITYKSDMFTGDFNGDGKADFLCLPNAYATWTGYKMYYGDGNDNFTLAYQNTSFNFGAPDDIRILDINADGKDDILYETVSSGTSTFKYIINTGSAFSSATTICTLASASAETGISGKKQRKQGRQENDNELSGTDYNGDGINDIFINNSAGNWKIYSLANASGGLTTTMSLKASGTISTLTQVLSGDFDGDGKPDIWSIEDGGVKIYTFTGSALSQVYSSTWPSKDHFFTLGDFNADGKVDVFLYGAGAAGGTEYDWEEWQVQFSTGTGFEGYYIPKKKNNLKDDYVRIGDFNGDGASDIMATSADASWSGAYFFISKNNGTDLYSHNLAGYPTGLQRYNVTDFNGDGRSDFLSTDDAPAWWGGYHIYKSGSKNNVLLGKIGNGIGSLIKIAYKPASQSDAPYTKGSGATFPTMDFQGPLIVVSSIQNSDGRGSQNSTTYAYQGIKIHRQGKGFLCMSRQTVTDVANNRIMENNYSYHSSKYFAQLVSGTEKAGSTTLSTVTNTWTYSVPATGVIFPYISSSTQTNNFTGHSVTRTALYDTYGNLTSSVKSFNNGVTETVTNVYTNDATNWLLGKITSSTVQYAKSGEATVSSTVGYTYSTDGKIKPDLIKYYEGTPLYYYKNHDYDSRGNLTQLYENGTGVTGPRQTNYTYEANGVRVATVTDAFGHTTEMGYNTYGRLSSEEDYLGNVTSYTYDEMGRPLTETQPDGFVNSVAYGWNTGSGPSFAVFCTVKSGNDGSHLRTWYDNAGREIRSDIKGFNGAYIYTATEYNTKGQLYRVSEPSSSASLTQWNVHSYDSCGWLTGITRPSGRNTTYVYSSNRVTETTGGKASWKETDSQGLVTKVHDDGGDIVYAYYPDGQVKTITAPGSAVTSMEYNDAARNQTKLTDPSAGATEYTWDAYGQIKTQKNARNQVTTFNYFADGRVNTKVTPEGTTTYSYNTNKQLTGIASPGSVSRSYGYDTKGRVNNISETIPSSSVFSTTFTYDDKGRLSTRTHPSGIVETNSYNSYGYLASVSAGGAVRYTVTAMNARQQITTATWGSNLLGEFGYNSYGYLTHTKAKVGSTYRQDYRYSFDPVTGNLSSRQNYLRSKSESFTCDNLDRLLTVTGPANLTMDYAGNGNILTKSDLTPGEYAYTNAAKPYAVTEINSANSVIPAVSQALAAYTSFEQPSTITETPYSATFDYNGDGQRAKMEVTQSGNAILTRWYTGSRYIKETAGSVTKEFTWIGGDAYTAPCLAVKQNSTTTYYYLLRDYLGTVTHVTDASGNVVNEYSFDVWGRRRDKDDWSYTLNGEPELMAGRGFTSHEWLPWFNLYNMNGRLYDPVVGRFLSPDPVIQDPLATQEYNRYSYALNNPLKYSDPTGYKKKAVKEEDYYSFMGHVYDLMRRINGGGGLSWWGSSYTGLIHQGYDVPVSDFLKAYDNAVGSDNATGIAYVPQMVDYYNAHSYDGGKTYYTKWEYLYSRTVNIPFEVTSKDGNNWGTIGNASFFSGIGLSGIGYAAKSSATYTPQYAYRGMAKAEAAAAKTLNGIAKGTKVLGYGATTINIITSGIKFYTSDRSWGDYGQLGIASLSFTLSFSGYTAPIGVGIGVIDIAGGFNGFYNHLDAQNQFYDNTGGVILPVNGIPYYLQLKR